MVRQFVQIFCSQAQPKENVCQRLMAHVSPMPLAKTRRMRTVLHIFIIIIIIIIIINSLVIFSKLTH